LSGDTWAIGSIGSLMAHLHDGVQRTRGSEQWLKLLQKLYINIFERNQTKITLNLYITTQKNILLNFKTIKHTIIKSLLGKWV